MPLRGSRSRVGVVEQHFVVDDTENYGSSDPPTSFGGYGDSSDVGGEVVGSVEGESGGKKGKEEND